MQTCLLKRSFPRKLHDGPIPLFVYGPFPLKYELWGGAPSSGRHVLGGIPGRTVTRGLSLAQGWVPEPAVLWGPHLEPRARDK